MSERRLSKEWTVSAFDRVNNEWTSTENQSYEHIPDPVELQKLLVREAAPTVIRPSRRKKPTRRDSLTLVAGDAQVPFHDPEALDLFQEEVVATQPDNIVFVGDMIDLQ